MVNEINGQNVAEMSEYNPYSELNERRPPTGDCRVLMEHTM